MLNPNSTSLSFSESWSFNNYLTKRVAHGTDMQISCIYMFWLGELSDSTRVENHILVCVYTTIYTHTHTHTHTHIVLKENHFSGKNVSGVGISG